MLWVVFCFGPFDTGCHCILPLLPTALAQTVSEGAPQERLKGGGH